MMRLDELSLPEIDIFDQAFAKDPHGTFHRARETGAWIAKYQFGYIPLDLESVGYFYRADDTCRTPNRDIVASWKAENTLFERFFTTMMIGLNGEAHRRLRRIVAPAFTPREANGYRDLMRDGLRATIEPWLSRGECDFAAAISRYPVCIICEMVGIPREDVQVFEDWLDKLEASYAQDAAALPELDRVIGAMFGYIDGILATRRGSNTKPADLLQTMLDLTEEGGLTDEEVRCMLVVLLGAGYDTTKNQLTSILYLMTQHPHYWVRAANQTDFPKKLIEESLRYMSPIGAMHRVTNTDIIYRDVVIPANTFISLSQNAAGRDPGANTNAECFDPDRERPVHIAFGQGQHFCLGQYIARALLEEAVPRLAKAMLDPKLAGDPTFRSPMGVWGLATLPISFSPGTL